MKAILKSIQACKLCEAHLPYAPKPIVHISAQSKIMIIGQAPGLKVQQSGVPWDDPSGKQLRRWLGVDEASFYNTKNFALVPMGFCYPGKGKSGDLPPRPECAPAWHTQLWAGATNITLTLLIGAYAQKYYLQAQMHPTLTETVLHADTYLPKFLPLPHPSPRNRFWLTKNPWFEKAIIPLLQTRVKEILA